MIALSYVTPQGEPIADPPLELLRTVIFDSDFDYWGNAGAAYLGWVQYRHPGYSDIMDRPHLYFFWKEPHGFHFMYDSPHRPRRITYDGSGVHPKVQHYSGGEPCYLPRACFVARELAWEVVQEFLRSQQPSPAVAWVNESQLDSDPAIPD